MILSGRKSSFRLVVISLFFSTIIVFISFPRSAKCFVHTSPTFCTIRTTCRNSGDNSEMDRIPDINNNEKGECDGKSRDAKISSPLQSKYRKEIKGLYQKEKNIFSSFDRSQFITRAGTAILAGALSDSIYRLGKSFLSFEEESIVVRAITNKVLEEDIDQIPKITAKIFFDIRIVGGNDSEELEGGGTKRQDYTGRITIGLYGEEEPGIVSNFLKYATNDRESNELSYENSFFYGINEIKI